LCSSSTHLLALAQTQETKQDEIFSTDYFFLFFFMKFFTLITIFFKSSDKPFFQKVTLTGSSSYQETENTQMVPELTEQLSLATGKTVKCCVKLKQEHRGLERL
jgi:hypothetical protein